MGRKNIATENNASRSCASRAGHTKFWGSWTGDDEPLPEPSQQPNSFSPRSLGSFDTAISSPPTPSYVSALTNLSLLSASLPAPEHAHIRPPRVPYSAPFYHSACNLSLNQCCTPPSLPVPPSPSRLFNMGLTKSQRIGILLGIDAAFFFVELIVGYAVHSLALVADAFHMLNDVLSLCVGLWAVRVANTGSSKSFTYGWQRAETLGALVNGVFLVALCLSIFLEAIQRFVEPQIVTNPKLVLIVGCLGFASNILGLLLFHDHSHGGGGHSHGSDPHKHAEEGHSHAEHSHGDPHEGSSLIGDERGDIEDVLPSVRVAGANSRSKIAFSRQDEENTTVSSKTSRTNKRKSIGAQSSTSRHRRRTSGFGSVDELPVHPASFRQGLIRASQVEEMSEPDSEEAVDDDTGDHHDHSAHASHGHSNGYGSINKTKSPEFNHENHNHNKKPEDDGSGGGGHGHSHGDLNMRGVFLHVLGDALGNVGVIVTALIIWLTPWSFRYYFDPAISLIITCIILASAIPLCKAASRILLQAVPVGLSIDEIKQDIEQLKGVVEAHHLHVWQLSDTKLVASLHVKVDCEVEGAGSASYMRLARAIRQCLHEYGIHSSTIQPEFLQGASAIGAEASVPSKPSDASPTQGGGSKANSVNSTSCMLECGEDCEDEGQCCPPNDAKDDAQK